MAATAKQTEGRTSSPIANAQDRVLPFRNGDAYPDVNTALDLFRFNMRLAQDVLGGKITPNVCRAAASAASGAIKALDLQYRMGNKPVLPIAG